MLFTELSTLSWPNSHSGIWLREEEKMTRAAFSSTCITPTNSPIAPV